MPYLSQDTRKKLIEEIPLFPGELNYIITSVLDQYIQATGLSYTTLNEMVGVLECAKMELYRRIAVPYEDKKLNVSFLVVVLVTGTSVPPFMVSPPKPLAVSVKPLLVQVP